MAIRSSKSKDETSGTMMSRIMAVPSNTTFKVRPLTNETSAWPELSVSIVTGFRTIATW